MLHFMYDHIILVTIAENSIMNIDYEYWRLVKLQTISTLNFTKERFSIQYSKTLVL